MNKKKQKLNIEQSKNMLINIMQETYFILKNSVDKDMNLLIGMGTRSEDNKRLMKDIENKIKDMLNQQNLSVDDCVSLIGLAIYNFYDFRFMSKWSSWFKFMYATDNDKSNFVQALFKNISDEKIEKLLVRVLVNSSKMYYAYNLDRSFYYKEIDEEEHIISKYKNHKEDDNKFKDFFDKI